MKHYRIDMMPTARAGLLVIGEYIAQDNPAKAIAFMDEIMDSLQKTLSLFPYSGRRAHDVRIDKDIRVWSYGKYNCYYPVVEAKRLVEILFVFHAHRDVQRLMSQM